MPEDVLPLWVADMDFQTIFLCTGCTDQTGTGMGFLGLQ